MKNKKLKVIELFAGVGGFRIGLERCGGFYETIWSNQFEPATKMQHASRIYQYIFKTGEHVNQDIATVNVSDIPDHDMLVGGFPCQDYSVTRILSQAKGLEGKKGVLWWEIYRILLEKGDKRPELLMLENVDRLLISPASQRGRDFAVMLSTLDKLGYAVEWRVVNAAEYGMPQRRRRTYILGYKKDSKIYKSIVDLNSWLQQEGVFATTFPALFSDSVSNQIESLYEYGNSSKDISDHFNEENIGKPFANAGVMIDGHYLSIPCKPDYHGSYITLGDIILDKTSSISIDSSYLIDEIAKKRWSYFKGAKHEQRKRRDGGTFNYSEGKMSFPDSLDKPARTIITAEGGRSASRTSHAILDPARGLRRLHPVELERCNMFPDNHTKYMIPTKPGGEPEEVKSTKRGFMMGNALVCGIVTKLGEELKLRLKK